MDDSRLDPHGLQSGQMTQLYGGQGPLRGGPNCHSPANLHGQQSTLLVVPQPLNATKIAPGLPNGGGRKYQCKMCPQVRTHAEKVARDPKNSREYSLKILRVAMTEKSHQFGITLLSKSIQNIIMSQRKNDKGAPLDEQKMEMKIKK